MWLALLQAGLLASYGSAAAALFLVACVEPEGDGRLAEIANWLFDAPERLLRACVGARRRARCAAYLCDEPNPVLQLLYLLLVGGGYGLAVADMYPRVPCAALGPHHRPAALALVLFCLGTWAKACTAPPGYVVDAATFAKHDNYAYDGCLYEAGGTCPTTGVPKPARAKFCRTTRRVVARFDHFCPWVNNAVGEENYRWFLLFLASHALLLAYGAACAALLLRDVVDAKQLMRATFYLGDAPVAATRGVVVHYLLHTERLLCALLLACAVLGAVVAGFLGYHLRLVWRGRTTNGAPRRRRRARGGAAPAAHARDLGALRNAHEVLFPRSRRRDAPRGTGRSARRGTKPKPATPRARSPRKHGEIPSGAGLGPYTGHG